MYLRQALGGRACGAASRCGGVELGEGEGEGVDTRGDEMLAWTGGEDKARMKMRDDG